MLNVKAMESPLLLIDFLFLGQLDPKINIGVPKVVSDKKLGSTINHVGNEFLPKAPYLAHTNTKPFLQIIYNATHYKKTRPLQTIILL